MQSEFTGLFHVAKLEKFLGKRQEVLAHMSEVRSSQVTPGPAGQSIFRPSYCSSGCSKRWLRGLEGMHKRVLRQAAINMPKTISIY